MNTKLRNELVTILGLGSLGMLLLGRRRAATGLGLTAAGLFLEGGHPETFRGKSVLITGGSRGLGLALADELMAEGAHVSLLARDADELERAKNFLLEGHPAGTVMTHVCDVTKEDDLTRAFCATVDEWNGIDMIVNNAGAITVGPFDAMSREDFETQLELHFYAVLGAVRLALPFFRQAGGGRIVNVCSLGGKIAVPHMLPYDTSKFALSGFSQGLAAELARENISVTTVYPTVMRTGSAIQAVFKGDQEKEYGWFQSLDVLPGISMSASDAAKKILAAARDRRSEVVLSSLGQLRIAAGVFFPEVVGTVMGLVARLLPGGTSPVPRTGADSRARFDRSAWTAPLRKRQREAERMWNQAPKSEISSSSPSPVRTDGAALSPSSTRT